VRRVMTMIPGLAFTNALRGERKHLARCNVERRKSFGQESSYTVRLFVNLICDSIRASAIQSAAIAYYAAPVCTLRSSLFSFHNRATVQSSVGQYNFPGDIISPCSPTIPRSFEFPDHRSPRRFLPRGANRFINFSSLV